MAIPGNITLITLTGQYLDFQGLAIDGQVKIYPSQILIDALADRIIIPSTITTDLVNGSFSVTVPVTDDVDVSPFNYFYYFEEAFNGGKTYIISLPASLGATVDITDLRSDVSLVSYIQPIAYQLWPPLITRTVAQETYYSGASVPATTLPIANTYQNLYIYFDTYGSMASTWGTYASAVNPALFLTNARIGLIYDRMTRLNNYSATTTDLRETTDVGVVTLSGNYAITAKWGTYADVANEYLNYNYITGTSMTWTYAQVGTLISQMGNALDGTNIYETASLTDKLLKLTRTVSGIDYGALERSGLTYAGAATTFNTYDALANGSFSNTLRDWADRLRSTANRPHQLLGRSYAYGINV